MSLRELRRHAGQLLLAGFHGTSLPVELRALAREFDLGGVILFARNVESPAQVAELAFEARALGVERPAWVAVDQEGGRVARLKRPFTEWPPMNTLGRSGDEGLAGRFATALARELRAVGITLDFAPVLDVLTNPANPAIGDRALAGEAGDVARLGRAIIEAMQQEGLAACGKHFPGHGDTRVDSHADLPVVEHPPDRLQRVEWVPFRGAIEAGVAGIMTAHVLVPALDETRPGTLSRHVVATRLRGELGYDGLVFTDDLDMRAISARWAVPDAAVMAVEAGCDALLICAGHHDTQAAAIEALVRAAEADVAVARRLEEARRRHEVAKARFVPARVERPADANGRAQVLGALDHQLIAEEMRRFA
jgi:beta-N-acetylhexosaminidase